MKNKKNKLGLPLEYQQMPEYFDAHNINEETEVKNALIEKLLREQKVKSVLDMTCGTGSQVFYLAERGYEVVGSDFSPALLDIARIKAKEKNSNITFIDGDMRNLKVGKFDAVITIFNAIGHLTKSDFEIALQNIHFNLKDNGIYIFDIFNLQAITDNIIDDFSMESEKVINGVSVHNIQHSEIDRELGLLTSHDEYTISKIEGEPDRFKNNFSLQIYTADELKVLLEKNGFRVIFQYDMEGNNFDAQKSMNILTVAKTNDA
jgi:ubiquinone/menaquinone biosynthesis C-methylase UbiE